MCFYAARLKVQFTHPEFRARPAMRHRSVMPHRDGGPGTWKTPVWGQRSVCPLSESEGESLAKQQLQPAAVATAPSRSTETTGKKENRIVRVTKLQARPQISFTVKLRSCPTVFSIARTDTPDSRESLFKTDHADERVLGTPPISRHKDRA